MKSPIAAPIKTVTAKVSKFNRPEKVVNEPGTGKIPMFRTAKGMKLPKPAKGF